MPNVVVPSSGGGQPGCESGSHLVDSIAVVVGGIDEDNIRAQALDCANRARNEVNMHDWRFLKRHIGSSAFSGTVATYSLPSAFKSPGFFQLLDVNGKPYRDIQYVDDAAFVHWIPQQTQTGPPNVYSLRNTFNDGLITFYPVPDATIASQFTYLGEYYTRVATIVDTSDPITDVPEEICNVIIAGGQYYLVSEREKGNANIVGHKWQDYQRIKNLALVNDRRMTDDNARFKMPARRGRFIGNSNDYYGWFWGY